MLLAIKRIINVPIDGVKRAFYKPGNYHYQSNWAFWWRIWPYYSAEEDVIDYGMPEYGGGPSYQVNTFCFSFYQAQWFSNLQGS